MSTLDKLMVGRVRDLYVYDRLSESDISLRLEVEPAVVRGIIEMLARFNLLTRPPLIENPKRKSW